eukprot:11387236-Alexandrium_andersonii.AAC.1
MGLGAWPSAAPGVATNAAHAAPENGTGAVQEGSLMQGVSRQPHQSLTASPRMAAREPRFPSRSAQANSHIRRARTGLDSVMGAVGAGASGCCDHDVGAYSRRAHTAHECGCQHLGERGLGPEGTSMLRAPPWAMRPALLRRHGVVCPRMVKRVEGIPMCRAIP